MRPVISDVPLAGSPFPPIADYGFLSDCEACALVAPGGNVGELIDATAPVVDVRIESL